MIGGPSVPNADLHLSDRAVFSTKKILQESGFEEDIINDGDSVPIGVALIYFRGALPEFHLTTEKPHIKLLKTNRWVSFIRSHLVDLVVYGRKSSSNRCNIFEIICDAYAIYPHRLFRKYLLRHFQPKRGVASMNRCTMSTEGFQPESFVISYPSPGFENRCQSSLKSISLLDQFGDEIQSDMAQAMVDSEFENQLCSADPESIAVVTSLDVDKVENVIERELEDRVSEGDSNIPSNEVGLQSTARETFEVSKADIRLMGLFGEPHPLYREKLNCEEDHITKIREHQSRLIDYNLVSKPHVCWWFEYVWNSAHPSRSKAKCHYCEKYYREYGFCKQYMPALAKEGGMLMDTFKRNNKIIDEHWKDPRHIKMVQTHLIKQVGTISDMYFTLQLRQDTGENAVYAATNRRFRSIYTLAKQGWSLRSHNELIKLQRANGLPMGEHYINYPGAIKMLKFVYHDNHEKLIDTIMNSGHPISLITDAATDNVRNHYLAVLFQTLEHGAPVVYFYKLIPLGSNENAKALLNKIVYEFEGEKHGFAAHMKRHLVGFSSDGASVMTAPNGLANRLETWCGRPLFKYHCAAHKLELVFKRSLHDDPYSIGFEKFLNKLHSFANSRSHKNKIFLKEIARKWMRYF